MLASSGVLLLYLLHGVIGDGNLGVLLKPAKRCVATDGQSGPCHVCSCTVAGVYHCLTVKCNEKDSTLRAKYLGGNITNECEPLLTYRQDTIVCSCNAFGQWKTLKCKEHFYQIRPNTRPITYEIGTNIPCYPGDYYVVVCNVCKCGDNGYIHFNSCTRRPCPHNYKDETCKLGDVVRTKTELCICSEVGYFIDRLCFKVEDRIVQRIEADDLKAVIDFGKYWDDLDPKCKPHYHYKLDCIRCICDWEGENLFCKDEKCEIPRIDAAKDANNAIRSTSNKVNHIYHHYLPELKDPNDKCKPGVKYRHKCNTCICNPNREAICTSMICLSDLKFSISDLRKMKNSRRNALI